MPPDLFGNRGDMVNELGHTTRKCAGCSKAILWAVNEDGARIPLDPVAPVYEVDGQVVRRTRQALVSHFATCPKADQFSAGRRT
jgi:hypothetical protein